MIDRIKNKLNSKDMSNKISFWFIRHGQSEGNLPGANYLVTHNAPLTEQGKLEAMAIAKYFKKNNIDITDIYSSPLDRTYETSKIIAKELGIPVKAKVGLKERDWGTMGNLSWEVVAEKLSGLSIEERFTFVPEGGESWEQMEERLTVALENIAEENDSGENILIVTHRGCLRAMLPVLAKAGRENHADYSVETGSLTKFSFDKEAFEFVGLNPSKQ